MARRGRVATAGALALLLAGCHAQRSAPAGTATAPRSTVSITLPATHGPTGRIADNGVDGDIWVMDADGSNLRRLTGDPPTYDAPNSWLPDGRIVVVSSREGEALPAWFTMEPDGSRRRALPQLQGAQAPIDWLP